MTEQHTYEFDSLLQFRAFEQSLENALSATQSDEKELFDGTDDDLNIIITELLDRAQRTRHGNRDDQPLQFVFYGNTELFVGVLVTLWSGHVTDSVGVPGEYDKKRIVRLLSAVAVDLEKLHPDDVIDEINIKPTEVTQ